MKELRSPEILHVETRSSVKSGAEISKLRKGGTEQPKINGKTSVFNEKPGSEGKIKNPGEVFTKGALNRPDSGRKIEQPKVNAKTHISEADNNKTAKPDVKENIKIPCRNEDLAGKEHPITGVRFEKRTVTVDGEKKEVVSPVFKSEYDAQLPKDKLKASDAVQFKECNTQLKDSVDNDPNLRGKFSEDQLEQIKNGDTPDGYTWHHDSKPGKMQLVETDVHEKTGHTGGRVIWGGGNENRGG